MPFQKKLNEIDTVNFNIGSIVSNNTDRIKNIPDDFQKTKQLSKETTDSVRAIKQANHQLDSIYSKLPEEKERMQKLQNFQSRINTTGNALYKNIENLKKKIAYARELANRIRVGLVFYPNTTLELKNPESLTQQATATNISLYFRTNKTNAFLLYLGNENRSDSRWGLKNVIINSWMKNIFFGKKW